MQEQRAARMVLPIEVGPVGLTLDASTVREVLGAANVTRLAGGPPGLSGVLPWGGRAVAVLDLAALVGEHETKARTRTVVVELGGTVVALPVDRVREPRPVADERPAHASRLAYAPTEVELDGSRWPLLDVNEWVRSLGGASA